MHARLSAAIATFALLASCSSAEPRIEIPQVRVAVSGRSQLIYLPLTLAVELGYTYDEGLNVALQELPDETKPLESLLAGSSDVVCGFFGETMQAAAQGDDVEAFLVLVRYPGLVAISLQPEINAIADLRGRRVGVPAMGSSAHLLLNYLLSRSGLAPDSVTPVPVGSPTSAFSAAMQGQLDAIIATDPAAGVVLRQVHGAHVLADTRTPEGAAGLGAREYPASVLYAKTEWLEARPELAGKLARAVQRAMSWMLTRPAQGILNRLPTDYRSADVEGDVIAMRATQAMLSPTGTMSLESAEAIRAALAVTLEPVRSRSIDLSKTFTNRFVPQ